MDLKKIQPKVQGKPCIKFWFYESLYDFNETLYIYIHVYIDYVNRFLEI